MKHVLEISGQKVLLSTAQIEIIAEVMAGVEVITNKYMRNASNGSNYIPQIETPLMHEWFKTTMVHQDYIDTVKLSMKLQAEENKS